MSEARMCDRCGHIFGKLTEPKIAREGKLLDLCNDCEKQIINFLDNKESQMTYAQPLFECSNEQKPKKYNKERSTAVKKMVAEGMKPWQAYKKYNQEHGLTKEINPKVKQSWTEDRRAKQAEIMRARRSEMLSDKVEPKRKEIEIKEDEPSYLCPWGCGNTTDEPGEPCRECAKVMRK